MSEQTDNSKPGVKIKPSIERALWVMLGLVLGEVSIVEYIVPDLKKYFVTHEQFEELQEDVNVIRKNIEKLSNGVED